MKKKALYLLGTICILATACRQETDTETVSASNALTARIAVEEPGTRVSFDSYEGKFLWNQEDEIALHFSDGTATGRYTVVRVSPNSPAETAAVVASVLNSMTRDYYAIYPADAIVPASYGNSELKVVLKDTYDISDIVAGTSTIHAADYSPVPMVAANDPASNLLDFYHVGGLLRITLNGVRAETQKVTVTFDKDVTGTYTVADPGTDHPSIATSGTSGNNIVTFTLAETALGETLAGSSIVLNVPVPCGTYNTVTVETLDVANVSLATRTYDTVPLIFYRHHGKKLAFGMIEFVLRHTGPTITLDDGTVVQEVVRNEDTAGATGTATFNSYLSADGGTTREDVEVFFEYAEADADGLPVRAGGEIIWSSSRPSTLSSVAASGSVAKTFSAGVGAYSLGIVKETESEFLKHAENLKSRSAVGTSVSPRDLSMYDIHGVSRGNQPVTANSYIVDRAGWYMFPIVYGNAIDYTKSGTSLYRNGVNAYAYKDEASPAANARDNWHNFQNFTGTGLISTPYILDDVGSLTSSDVEAVVVWQDVESSHYSFIGNISVTNVSSSNIFYDPVASIFKGRVPYIKFEVPMGSIDPDETKDPFVRVTGIRQGNAVIALRLKTAKTIGGTSFPAETILWSWHIWITDGYDTDGDNKGDGLTPIPVTNHAGTYTLNVMPLNLGWCDQATTTVYKDRVWYVRVHQDSGSEDPIIFRVVQKKAPATIGSSGTFYQWGRKDPFISSSGSGNMNKAVYSPSGYTLTASTNTVSYDNASPADNSSKAIQNPFIHYYSSDTYGWMSSVYPYNLWNMATGINTADVAVSKTVYDPCPPGYCVPRKGAFTNFTKTGDNAYIISELNVKDLNEDGAITSEDFDKGWYFYTSPSGGETIFFPAAGARNYENSALHLIGTHGRYWLAAPQWKSDSDILTRKRFDVSFDSGSVGPINYGNDWSFGLAVRAIEEE